MANPNPSPSTRFQKGNSGNPGGMTKEQREARDAVRRKLADDADEVHDALLALIRERNPAAVVYAHGLLHGKDPLELKHSGGFDNPATPITTEKLLAIAEATKDLPAEPSS